MTDKDWRTLDAGRALDRLIAERAGFEIRAEIVYYESDTREHDGATFPGDKVYGGEHKAWVGYKDGEREGWAYRYDDPKDALIRGYDSLDEINAERVLALLDYIGMPDYSTDLNAAITLIRPDWVFMLSSLEPNRWHCSINGISSKLSNTGDGMAETPALAVCRAWLEWKDKNPAKRTFGSAPGVWMSKDFDADDIGFEESDD